MDLSIEHFAKEVGGVDDGPVCCVGGRTAWSVGGPLLGTPREVRAPSGIVEFEPAEMVVRVRAGTTVGELSAVLAAGGQQHIAAFPREVAPGDAFARESGVAGEATVGGVLAVGRSGVRRLRYGPVRDTLLEATVVLASGKVVKAGGPVVKNVSGYDLCRLMVGSLGTLGFLAEVVLRCSPVPAVSQWFLAEGVSPFDVRDRLFRPSSILWDGASTWVLIEGHPADVGDESAALGAGWSEVEGPPPLPAGGRLSMRPSELRSLTTDDGRFVAEIGVGTVHLDRPLLTSVPHMALNSAMKAAFDPTGRMNPGRQV